MRWRSFRKSAPVPPEGVDEHVAGEHVAGEIEAYLSGEYVAWLLRAGLPVPGWARLNLVAHGSHAAIVRSVQAGGVPKEACCFRHAAMVVEAVVVATLQREEVPRVQRELLVPLELELMAAPVSPSGIVAFVLEELF